MTAGDGWVILDSCLARVSDSIVNRYLRNESMRSKVLLVGVLCCALRFTRTLVAEEHRFGRKRLRHRRKMAGTMLDRAYC